MKSKFKFIALASLFTFSALAFTGCGHWYKHKSPEEKAEWVVDTAKTTSLRSSSVFITAVIFQLLISEHGHEQSCSCCSLLFDL